MHGVHPCTVFFPFCQKPCTFPFTAFFHAFFSKLKSIVDLKHFWDKVRRPTLGRDLSVKFYKRMRGIRHPLKRIISTKHGQAKYRVPQQFEIDSLVCWLEADRVHRDHLHPFDTSAITKNRDLRPVKEGYIPLTIRLPATPKSSHFFKRMYVVRFLWHLPRLLLR